MEQETKRDSEKMRTCGLCPRNCKRNRVEGEVGVCGEASQMRVARAALHMWEEPCISGEKGSGAIFFSGCPLHCVYCQNYKISKGGIGRRLQVRELVQLFYHLESLGAANINLVTADHFIPEVAEAITIAKKDGFSLPFIYNTSSYVKVEALRRLEGCVDVYLPDMKYMEASTAKRYSNAADYPEVAKLAIAEMVRQCGTLKFDAKQEYIKRGVIVRHMLLPEHLLEAEQIVRYLYETYGNQIYMSLMSQYTPVAGIGESFPELLEPVRKKSYRRLIAYAIRLGVEQAFYQEGDVAKESFIPDFMQETFES